MLGHHSDSFSIDDAFLCTGFLAATPEHSEIAIVFQPVLVRELAELDSRRQINAGEADCATWSLVARSSGIRSRLQWNEVRALRIQHSDAWVQTIEFRRPRRSELITKLR